jgi:hypothetical protein
VTITLTSDSCIPLALFILSVCCITHNINFRLVDFVRQAAPLCSVPIKTTATLNIQLFPVPGGKRSPDGTRSDGPLPRVTVSTATSPNAKSAKIVAVSADVISTSPTAKHPPHDHEDALAVRRTSEGSSSSRGSTDQRSATEFKSSETMTDQLPASGIGDEANSAFDAAAAAAAISSLDVATSSEGIGEDDTQDVFTATVQTDSSPASATDTFTSTGDLTAQQAAFDWHGASAWTAGDKECDASESASTSATCSVSALDSSQGAVTGDQWTSAAVGEDSNEFTEGSSESHRSEVAEMTVSSPAAASEKGVDLDQSEASSFR